MPLIVAPLTANARVHWTARARNTKLIRESVGLAALSARRNAHLQPNLDQPRELRLTLLLGKGERVKDADNATAACKAIVDSLVTPGGWLVNDTAQWLTKYEVAQERAPDGKRAVQIEISPCPPRVKARS